MIHEILKLLVNHHSDNSIYHDCPIPIDEKIYVASNHSAINLTVPLAMLHTQ